MIAYIKEIFGSANTASFARWATAFTVATGCFAVIRVVVATHQLPDAGALAGMCAFMTAPYAVNKAAAAFRSNR
jgi:hypothetical protein